MNHPAEHQGKHPGGVDDEGARAQILHELDVNLLVEAAAGTGKTTCIVGRMVNLVAAGRCQLRQLAAITFTRKAAAELRERFLTSVRREADALASETIHNESEQARYDRLRNASDHASQAYIGTIHSFCASLLRERPMEFGVAPNFRELDEQEDAQLREQAWLANIDDLVGGDHPLMDRLRELGIDIDKIRDCFGRFIEYRDVEDWATSNPREFDVELAKNRTRSYIDHMKKLIEKFPPPSKRGTDKLMGRYETISVASERGWSSDARFFELLDHFDTGHSARNTLWHDKDVGKEEKDRWDTFRETVAAPGMAWWAHKRYQFVVDFLNRAVQTYESLKKAGGGLGFSDILLRTAAGLRDNADLRRYFQQRYTHLLVDEFQDTDPIQAEIVMLLASSDAEEKVWTACKPRDGAIFLVGDPKQSIYRFRRGDIVTYQLVSSIFTESGGQILKLIKNFRSDKQLIEWNNRVFSAIFPVTANTHTPAAENMVHGRQNAATGSLVGVKRLTVPRDMGIQEATEREADTVARYIRHALDSQMTVPRRQEELDAGRTAEIQPSDFLIIPRGKARIHIFREALDRYTIPCEVAGGNAFARLDELEVLVHCLRAIDDPFNPVHLLAVLRERLFGFSDAELFAFKQAGGQFRYNAKIPEDLDSELRSRFQEVSDRLNRYQRWLRALPFIAAVTRIAQDLGLLASTCVSAEGNVSAGALLASLEWIRAEGRSFDSASDLISSFERLRELKESQSCTAFSPENNAVRIMNLHKAKGLEAPVVFLVDTSAPKKWKPECHIDRSGGKPVGYMGITRRHGEWGSTRAVAAPENWSGLQTREQAFLDAEKLRLLYVATTRAACQLVVSVGADSSGWGDLHRFLNDVPELSIPEAAGMASLEKQAIAAEKPPVSSSVEETRVTPAQKWERLHTPSYETQTAKELGLKGRARPRWETTGDYGYRWGSAVHELLEACSKSPQADLRPIALALAMEFHLGAHRVEELLATVNAVTESEIWKRSQAAERRFSELPFETVANDETGKPTILRGVIDLIFEEPDGWIVVDYKTDELSVSDLPKAVEYYRGQLELYSNSWRQMTGFKISELGIFFTRLNRYERV